MTTTSIPTTRGASTAIEQVQPYLDFNGRCEEALEFYREALGAEVTMLLRVKDSPEPASCPESERPPGDKVMHASFRIGSTEVMASDGMCTGQTSFNGISLSLTTKSVSEAQHRFAKLAQGGDVRMPMDRTFFSPAFGMLADKFGVSWMVYVKPPEPGQ